MRFTDDQRRVRLARRHGIHPEHRHPDQLSAVRSMTALHATEPSTVYLSLHARVDGLDVGSIEQELMTRRGIVKLMAMRRTIFGFTQDLLPAVIGSASARVAAAETRRLAADLERSGVTEDGISWVEEAAAAALAHLIPDLELDSSSLRQQVPVLATPITFGTGKWARTGPVVTRILTILSARGHLVRGRNLGNWWTSRPLWTPTGAWLGRQPVPVSESEGYARLVSAWLWTFGPGTETDLVWWFGTTKTAIRRALADLGATQVLLDSGEAGWVLPEDELPDPEVEPWAALLPTLDPTTMGWKQRDFYLDPADTRFLFDSVGNGGPTAWWNGRIVGTWVQDPDAEVKVVLRTDPGPAARRALAVEADRLTAFLDGQKVPSPYATALALTQRLDQPLGGSGG